MVKRVKDRSEVEEKMKDRVGTAGKYLVGSLNKAEDPIDILLSDPDFYIDKLVKGVTEAQRTGKIKSGLEKAKARNSWQESIPRAGAHYEERTDDMVKNALSDYDARKQVIETALNMIKDMPSTTRAQRIARSTAYQKAVGEGFDKLYGRKA